MVLLDLPGQNGKIDSADRQRPNARSSTDGLGPRRSILCSACGIYGTNSSQTQRPSTPINRRAYALTAITVLARANELLVVGVRGNARKTLL